MKAKQISLFLAGALLMSSAALAESSYTGTARGFGGDVTAEVGLDDAGKVVSLTVTADSETPTVGGAAIEPLVAAIQEKGDADVRRSSRWSPRFWKRATRMWTASRARRSPATRCFLS